MLVFLDGIDNSKWNPNENYAREMMELFSLGADRGAYTETDVQRDGAHADRLDAPNGPNERRLHELPLRPRPPRRHAQDGLRPDRQLELERRRAAVRHPPAAPLVLRQQAVGLLRPDAARRGDARRRCEGVYTGSGYSIRPVVEAILQHPDFYEGPELVTPPVVYNAGLLRAIGRYIDTTAWAWLSSDAGQQLFYPPNVSGWDFTRWLDTSTCQGALGNRQLRHLEDLPQPVAARQVDGDYSETEEPAAALTSAMAYWGNPTLSDESQQCIADFAADLPGRRTRRWEQSPYRAIRQNALRMLIATSPDMQVS